MELFRAPCLIAAIERRLAHTKIGADVLDKNIISLEGYRKLFFIPKFGRITIQDVKKAWIQIFPRLRIVSYSYYPTKILLF